MMRLDAAGKSWRFSNKIIQPKTSRRNVVHETTAEQKPLETQVEASRISTVSIKDVKLEFFHNRSSNRYNRLKTGHRFHLRCRLRGGGRNRQILLRETCSISIGLVVGIHSPPLHSVACLYSRGSQVAIEFGLGRRIRGDAGRYKLQWRRHQTCRCNGRCQTAGGTWEG